ncbi:MAG: hypothetical protein C5B54_02325 [Acidobacteria bacterium]|nr:MAG: hypothetical protein C5B54_02325 [Acidobacteriota bacterium]
MRKIVFSFIFIGLLFVIQGCSNSNLTPRGPGMNPSSSGPAHSQAVVAPIAQNNKSDSDHMNQKDLEIKNAIAEKLQQNDVKPDMTIEVYGQVVRVSGTVSNQDEAEHIVSLIRQVPGIKNIDSTLEVAS